MKKIIALVLVAAMLCFAMESCKKKEDPKTDPAPETRYTVTAEEWTAAMSALNYTFNVNGVQNMTSEGTTVSHPYSMLTKSTATATYTKNVSDQGTADEEVYECYYVIENGVGYELEMEGTEVVDVWKDSDPEIETFMSELGFELEFTDLTYNAETKAYAFSQTEEDEGMTVTESYSFFFENGKLVKIAASMTRTMGENSMVINVEGTVSNVGTTTVTVPAFTKPE